MAVTKPPVVLSGLNITNPGPGPAPAITYTDNNLTLNPSASIQMGSITLTEETFAKMGDILEFVERFAQEDERANAVWCAIKAKKRILG
jgi:hypothetical protein